MRSLLLGAEFGVLELGGGASSGRVSFNPPPDSSFEYLVYLSTSSFEYTGHRSYGLVEPIFMFYVGAAPANSGPACPEGLRPGAASVRNYESTNSPHTGRDLATIEVRRKEVVDNTT